MSSDTGIKLFGKTIAIPFCSEEDGEDYDKCSPRDKEQLSEEPRSAEENQDDHNDRQEKTALKKPDKILACPRCRSMDTKFCYYNNYNINQPRHFCKNCQRYWTAGGTMRNVPVGAGRRRSKNSANSQFQQLIISDTTLKANDGSSNNSGSRVLSFGCDALPAAANEHKTATATSNPIDDSSGANFQWAPWPYPWAPPPTPIIWGYGTPWISPIVMTTSSSSAPASGHLSPLGKHSRERNGVSKEYEGDSGRKGNIWIPKTLRIDDPEEAAKRSIWAAMGFDNEKSDKCLFKPFPKKSVELKANSNSQLLNVNPASLSRSVNFQEGS